MSATLWLHITPAEPIPADMGPFTPAPPGVVRCPNGQREVRARFAGQRVHAPIGETLWQASYRWELTADDGNDDGP